MKEKVRTYMKELGGLKVKVMGRHEFIGVLFPDRCVVVSLNLNELYIPNPIDNYHTDGIPEGYCVMLDYLFEIEQVINLKFNPEAFWAELIKPPTFIILPIHSITIDGKLMFANASIYRINRTRDKFLRRRKRDQHWEHYKFTHMRVTDIDGLHTDFTFPNDV